ncbi:MAG TPA: DUF5325 family protein [Bacillales bacterium]|nr:DUF5325 family protein [Bacillales bacterium]
MGWRNVAFLVLSILTFACLFAIGAAVAEHSTVGVVLSIIGAVACMAAGFTLKRRLNASKG